MAEATTIEDLEVVGNVYHKQICSASTMRLSRYRPKTLFFYLALTLLTLFTLYVMNQSMSLIKEIHFKSKPHIDGEVEYIADNLVIRYTVLSNTGPIKNHHEILLTNNGKQDITKGPWSIYFTHLFLPEHDYLRYMKSYHLPNSNFVLEHLDGGLVRLLPSDSFEGIEPGASTIVKLNVMATAARCYVFPHWYVAAPGAQARTIKSTDDESLSFVGSFDAPHLWKKHDNDYSKPFTPQERFRRYNVLDMRESPLRIIPTPLSSQIDEEASVDLGTGDWSVCNSPPDFARQIEDFASLFGIRLLTEKEPCPPSHVVHFIKASVPDVPDCDEAYQLTIENRRPSITIQATTSSGVFNAKQTILSLAEQNDGVFRHTLPACVIKDAPRFGYRGLHLDVARNFFTADDVIGIIKAMALYKMNKLHFHLTDDEAWRLEIPGLPELTEIGAKRCHTMDESDCIFPALGSGPDASFPGSGYYTASDYKRILHEAALHNVEVIPEIDLPGHSHAAIKSMEARYNRLWAAGKTDEAVEFLLSDFEDKSSAMSVQHYRNNAVNPCMPSTMRFVEKVIDAVVEMHADVQPLKTFHVGGDEVASNSWQNSPICTEFLEQSDEFPWSHNDLQEYFMQQVAKIVSRKNGLGIGAWEDGAMQLPENIPFNKSSLSDVDVMAYAWNNAWKSKNSERAYALANAGYKVILSPATHFYFDHPQEPDPEEVGLFWATRFSDDRKVFYFAPDDLYGNAVMNDDSVPFTAEEVDRIRDSHPSLEKAENVIGMQAQLWSELVRDVATAHSQLFPRLIAFAERAWHRAQWESDDSRSFRYVKYRDWSDFANVVGYKELARLRSRGIKYRVPPPGVRVERGTLEICGLYPGMKYMTRTLEDPDENDEVTASDWLECFNGQPMEKPNKTLEFQASDGERNSRVVKLKPNGTKKNYD